MFDFFRARPILSDEDFYFQIETYKWLLKNFGGKDFFEKTELVLPTKTYFKTLADDPHEVAVEIFDAVKKYAGMEDWPCILEAQEEDIETKVAPTIVMENVPDNPLGTFRVVDDENIVITYNPNLLGDPSRLVATLAHELAHYLTSTASDDPPGGWDNCEFVTDIAANYLGFGIFMANSTFNFKQYADVDSQGWEYQRSGYLSEAEHVFALALFLALTGRSTKDALPYLKPNLARLLKKAAKQITSNGIVEHLLISVSKANARLSR